MCYSMHFYISFVHILQSHGRDCKVCSNKLFVWTLLNNLVHCIIFFISIDLFCLYRLLFHFNSYCPMLYDSTLLMPSAMPLFATVVHCNSFVYSICLILSIICCCHLLSFHCLIMLPIIPLTTIVVNCYSLYL